MTDDSSSDSTYSLDDHVSVATREQIREQYPKQGAVVPVLQPPVYAENITDLDIGVELSGRLHGLAWLARGFNEATSAVMAKSHFYDPDAHEIRHYDELRYPITDESVTEVGIAVGLLRVAFEREMAACASLLDADDEPEYREEWGYRNRRAIRDALAHEPADHARPVREVADEMDASPEAVEEVLADAFGSDAVDRIGD